MIRWFTVECGWHAYFVTPLISSSEITLEIKKGTITVLKK